jgi:hypothetical protein
MKEKPDLYQDIEEKIKKWEDDDKDIAENAIVRLSETILPNETTVNMYQLVMDGLFAIVLTEDDDYSVIYLCSDYLESYAKLLEVLDEIMFGGGEETEEEINEEPMKEEDVEELSEVSDEGEEKESNTE